MNSMDDALTNDFPFVAELPKREKSKLANFWDAFQEIKAIQAEHGSLIPDAAAAFLLDLSRQRIGQLCDVNKLTRIEWHGHRYVTENSLVAFAREERKNGRPQKTINECAKSPRLAWKAAKSFVVK